MPIERLADWKGLRVRSSIAMLDFSRHIAAMSESKQLKRPRDPNQLAKLVTDIAVGDLRDQVTTEDGRDLAAVILGRRGGLKGGRARAQKLSAEQRHKIAKAAAEARWKKSRGKQD